MNRHLVATLRWGRDFLRVGGEGRSPFGCPADVSLSWNLNPPPAAGGLAPGRCFNPQPGRLRHAGRLVGGTLAWFGSTRV